MVKFKNTPNKCYNVDDKEIWVSRSLAVNGVIIVVNNYNSYVLAGQRGSGSPDFRGLWNVPSGYLDYDETCSDACLREIYEETGLDIKELIKNNMVIVSDMEQPWFVNSDPTSNRQNVSLRYGMVVLLSGEVSDDYSIDENKFPILTNKYSEPNEVSDLKWINIKDVDNYEWAFNHDKVIKEYLHRIENVNHYNFK